MAGKKRGFIKKKVYKSSIGGTKLTPGAEIYIVLPLGPNEPQHWCHNFCTNFILHINHRPEKTTITTPLCIPNESKNMLVSLKMCFFFDKIITQSMCTYVTGNPQLTLSSFEEVPKLQLRSEFPPMQVTAFA